MSTGQEAETSRLIVSGGRVVLDPGRAPLPDATVVVAGGRIEAVVPAGGELPGRESRETLDGRGLTVIPGLVSTHAHLTMDGPDPATRADPGSGPTGGLTRSPDSRPNVPVLELAFPIPEQGRRRTDMTWIRLIDYAESTGYLRQLSDPWLP